jgi:pyruvate,orthophosphate dikinase
MGSSSATGVGFTRNPGTGENVMYGEYLVNAQGEDVVAGIRTPKPVQEMEYEMPEMYRQLVDLRNRLENHYKEVQDYEYTIENGTLYCLQTRNGKMNAAARVRTSVEMANEGLIDRDYVERYTLGDDGRTLTLHFTMTDPEYLAEPVTDEQHYNLNPGYELQEYLCDPETARRHLSAGED